MKVSDLTGALLDYWVARSDETWRRAHLMFPAWTLDPTFKGVELVTHDSGNQECVLIPNNPFRQDRKEFAPSCYWDQAGPIIERERIAVWPGTEAQPFRNVWTAGIADAEGVFRESDEQLGDTPLIAAMRAFVASKFGDELPDETEGV